MKPTLLILLVSIGIQPQLCQARSYTADCLDHAGLFYGEESKDRNAFRTDTCSFATGKMEITYCRLPGDNKNISSSNSIGAKVRCEAYGRNGILVTRREYFETLPPSILYAKDHKRVCMKGDKQFQPNTQWIEGSFIRRCDPDTLVIDYVGCRSKDGIFVPLGSKKMAARDVENVGRVVTTLECQSRDAHYGIGYEFTEKIYIRPENDFEGCVNVWNNAEVLLKVGEEKVVDGVVHVCDKDVIYQTRIAGCVTKFANFIRVGQNVTERPDLTKGKPSYNSLCLATQNGAKLKIEIDHKSDDKSGSYKFLKAPTCDYDNKTKLLNKQEYRVGRWVYQCNIDHHGKRSGIWFDCSVIKNADGRPRITNVQYLEICSRNAGKADGKTELSELEAETKSPNTPKTTVGCIGHKGLVPIGETAHVNGSERRCTLIKDGIGEWRVYLESKSYIPH